MHRMAFSAYYSIMQISHKNPYISSHQLLASSSKIFGKLPDNLSTKAYGDFAEYVAKYTMSRAGYTSLAVKLPSDNGLDGLFVKFDSGGNVCDIVPVESKYQKNAKFASVNSMILKSYKRKISVNYKDNVTITRDGKLEYTIHQMSRDWLKEKIQQMQASPNSELNYSAKLMVENFDRLVARRKLNVVNVTGENSWYNIYDRKNSNGRLVDVSKNNKLPKFYN